MRTRTGWTAKSKKCDDGGVLLQNRRILYQNENPRIWTLGTNWNIIYEVCVNRNMYVHEYVGSRIRILVVVVQNWTYKTGNCGSVVFDQG